jgi:hypothetical protein
MMNLDYTPIIEAASERRRAHEKHGNNSIEATPADSPRWLAILGEEVGEVSEEILHALLSAAFGKVARASTYDQNPLDRRKELIQVIGVAWAWVNAIDAHKSDAVVDRITAMANHHDRLHGFCAHGELKGNCYQGGYRVE